MIHATTVTADIHNVVTLCTLKSHVRSEHNATVTADYLTPQSAVVVVRSGHTNFPPSDQIRKQINLKPNLKDFEDTDRSWFVGN